MTRSEAHQIVIMLKLGRSFGAHFKEQEWELTYLGSGLFENHGARFRRPSDPAATPEVQPFRETLKEPELVTWLCRNYSMDQMLSCRVDDLV